MIVIHPKVYEECKRLADEWGIPEDPPGTRGWRIYMAYHEAYYRAVRGKPSNPPMWERSST